MSKMDAELDRAAATYWLNVANGEGAVRSAALNRAADLLRVARAEAREPGLREQLPLDQRDRPQTHRLTR